MGGDFSNCRGASIGPLISQFFGIWTALCVPFGGGMSYTTEMKTLKRSLNLSQDCKGYCSTTGKLATLCHLLLLL